MMMSSRYELHLVEREDGKVRRRIVWPDWRATQLGPRHYQVYRSKAKKLLLNAGRAYGKDHILHLRALSIAFWLYAVRKRNAEWRRFGPVVNLGVLAPTSKNFADLWKRFKDLVPAVPGTARNGEPNVRVLEKTEEVEFFGENELLISFGSVFQGDNVRGGGFDVLVGTEAAYMKEETLRGAIIPLVRRPNYAGYVMLNSTPRGTGHWWDQAIEDARAGVGYWGGWELHEGTYADNPKTTAEDVADFEAEKASNIYAYRQQRLAWLKVDVPEHGILAAGTQLAFSPETVRGILLNQRVEPQRPFYIGMDLAGAGPDALTVVVTDALGVVIHLEKHRKTEIEEIVDLMERLNDYWKPRAISYDGNGRLGKEVRGRLRVTTAKPVITGRDKAELVRTLESHMLVRSVRIPNPEFWKPEGKYQEENLALLLKEVREYRKLELKREVMRNQRIRDEVFTTYSKPPGGSDDFVDALVYAVLPRPAPMLVRDGAAGDGGDRPRPAMSSEELGW